jgi:hypothetical protein
MDNKKSLKIEETAASDQKIETEEDRQLIFNVIQWVMKHINIKCGHSMSYDNNLGYFELSFEDVPNLLSLRKHIEPIVSKFSKHIRNLTVMFPPHGSVEKMKIVIELYKADPHCKRKKEQPPVFVKKNQRKDMILEILEKRISEKTLSMPKTWSKDKQILQMVSENMRNMTDEQLETDISFISDIENGPLNGAYEIKFNGVKNITYDFMESLADILGKRIEDIEFQTTDLITRSVSFVIGKSSIIQPTMKKRKISRDIANQSNKRFRKNY